MLSGSVTDRDGVEGKRSHECQGTVHLLWRKGKDGGYTMVAAFATRSIAIRFWHLLADGNDYVLGTARGWFGTRPEFKQHYSGGRQVSRSSFNAGPADLRMKKERG